MSRKLRLHRESIRQLTRPDAANVAGGMVTPAVRWTAIIPTLVTRVMDASIQMCSDWGACVTGQCSDACGPDTSPVTACACLPSDAPGYC